MRNLSGETKKLLAFLAGLFMVLVFVVVIVLTQQPPTITKTEQIALEVTPAPDFLLTLSTDFITTHINRTIGFAATVESVNNFAGDIAFSVTGEPQGAIISFFPSDTITLGPDQPRGISVEIIIPNDANAVGNYTIIVTAESSIYN